MSRGYEFQQREAFLERTRTDLYAGLASVAMNDVIGTHMTTGLKRLNDLLYLPAIEDGVIQLPPDYEDTDAMPFVAYTANERFAYDLPLATPTPKQQKNLARFIQSITDEPAQIATNAVDEMVGMYKHRLENDDGETDLQTVGFIDDNTHGFTGAHLEMAGAEDVENDDKPELSLLLAGRPVVMLRYGRVPSAHVALVAHLVRALDYFDNPGQLANGWSDTVYRHRARRELTAHRIAALYGVALMHDDGASVPPAGEDLLEYIRVEDIRRSHADPEDPYAITPGMSAELQRNGYHWA